MKLNFWDWTKKRLNKKKNKRNQVELAFFYLFDFRAKQDSGSTRLSSLRKVYIKIEALLLKKISFFYKENMRNYISRRNIFV